MNRWHTGPNGIWPNFKLRHHPNSPSGFFEEGGRRLYAISHGHEDMAISFLTVVKNRHATIGRTIKSILSQSNAKVEHIIVDGLSNDGTLDVIRAHAKDIEYYVSREDRNLYQAINEGIELCRGRYICILNSDDWLTRGSINQVLGDIASLSTNREEPILCYGAWKHTENQKPKLWQPQEPRIGDYFHCSDLCHNAMYIPRSAYLAIGPYDDTYQIIADTKWIMGAVEHALIFKINSFPTCFYSMNGVSSNGRSHWTECLRLITERFPSLSPDEVEGLLNRFYAFKSNIPRGSQPGISDTTLTSISRNSIIAKFIDSARSPRSTDRNITSKWSIKFKKLIWRIKHIRTT